MSKVRALREALLSTDLRYYVDTRSACSDGLLRAFRDWGYCTDAEYEVLHSMFWDWRALWGEGIWKNRWDNLRKAWLAVVKIPTAEQLGRTYEDDFVWMCLAHRLGVSDEEIMQLHEEFKCAQKS